MILVCRKCNQAYDNAELWDTCPHNPLTVPVDAKYCEKHALLDCQLCKLEAEEARRAKEGM